jgi:hypothetical protein
LLCKFGSGKFNGVVPLQASGKSINWISEAKRMLGRFGLRSFFVFVTAMCLGLMGFLFVDERRRQTRVARWVTEHSGQTNYDYQINVDGTIAYGGSPKPSILDGLIFDSLLHSNIVDIYFPDSRIVNIEPLRGLRRLEKLDLSGTNVVDLSPLTGNRKLWYLNLTQGRVVDIGPLRKCTGLRYLSLYGTGVGDLEPLVAMKQLRYLSVENTPVQDLQPISDMKLLEELYLAKTKISNIDVLESMVNLKSLSLNGTTVKNLQPLYELKNLEEVWINDTAVPAGDVEVLRDRLPDCAIYF